MIRERRIASSPSDVRGPVLGPPCLRQRPLAMAGATQAVPRLVLAPHLAACVKSPGGLPFFNQPRRVAGGSAFIFRPPPFLRDPPRLTLPATTAWPPLETLTNWKAAGVGTGVVGATHVPLSERLQHPDVTLPRHDMQGDALTVRSR